MKNALITLTCLFGLAITAIASDTLRFIIEPGASLQRRHVPYPAPTEEILEEVERQVEQTETRVQQGMADRDTAYRARLALLRLQLAVEGATEKDRLATYSSISKVAAERAQLIKARHHQGMATAADMLTTKAQAAWARAMLAFSANPEGYEKNLQIAHNSLTELVKECETAYRRGLVGHEAGLVAEIALGEVEVLQLYWQKNRRAAAKRTQELYNKLIKLCEARTKAAGTASAVAQTARARIAAATYARECALHLYRDPAAARRAQKQLCNALGSLQKHYTHNYESGLCTIAELNAISARLAAEWQRLEKM